MGKIKIHTLGSEDEKAQKEKLTRQREEKKKREAAEKVHVSGMGGGERVKSVNMSEEEVDKMAKLTQEVEKDQAESGETKEEKKSQPKKARVRSKKYQEALGKVDKNKLYELGIALKLLRDVTLTKFDGTVEIHINTVEKGLRGSVQLPHGTGREVRVKIADDKTIDAIVESINGGKIDFDVLIAHPGVMSKLARVARILGPKGLMPNPKSGTISPTPEKVADKMSKGEIQWKTEADFPLIHQVLGKLSFKDEQLQDNFKALVKSIDQIKISKITIKSTMSPGIKVEL